jgi:hypothetical protein
MMDSDGLTIVTGLGVDSFAVGKANEAYFAARFTHFRRMAGLKAKGAVQQEVKTQIKVRDLIKASKTVDERRATFWMPFSTRSVDCSWSTR